MAVVQWDSDFEATPAAGDAPSGGDDRIRELKATARSIIDKEHQIDYDNSPPSAGKQGWHREGSAIAYYKSSEPSTRPDGSTELDDDDAGRLWIDSDNGRVYGYTGSEWEALTLDTAISDELADMTVAEIQQLQNIGSTTISSTQWGYVGGANQSVRTTDDVEFDSVTSHHRPVSVLHRDTPMTEDTFFHLFEDLIPNVGDRLTVTGSYGKGAKIIKVVSYVERVSADEIDVAIGELDGDSFLSRFDSATNGTFQEFGEKFSLSW